MYGESGIRNAENQAKEVAKIAEWMYVGMMLESEADIAQEVESRVGRPLYDECGKVDEGVLSEFRDQYVMEVIQDVTSMVTGILVRRKEFE